MDLLSQEGLAQTHLPLVDEIVRVMQHRFGPEVDRDDIRSFALEGLAIAIKRFDPSRNVSFKTFAKQRIKGAIYDGFYKSSWFPRRLRRKIAFYRKSEEMLRQRAAEPKSADRVEAVHRLASTLKELATAYVTTYVAEAENEPVSVPPDAERDLELKRCCRQLHLYLDKLPEKQKVVIDYYFFQNLSLSQVADRIGKNKAWTYRILRAGLDNLRKKFDVSDIPFDAFEKPP